MKRFFKYLLIALTPAVLVNLLCWTALVWLSVKDDLTYVNYASAFDKEQRLDSLKGHSKVVIIGGSNARFGFHSPQLEDSLHLPPVNMGIHIGLGLDYMFRQVEDRLQAGDILIISAEYQHFLFPDTYRGDEGLTDMYLMRHQWGKAAHHIAETHNYLSMYRLIRKRVKRIGMQAKDIPPRMETRTRYNRYGDYTGHYNRQPARWNTTPLRAMPDQETVAAIRRHIRRLQSQGITTYLLPPPYCRSSYETDSSAIAALAACLAHEEIPFAIPPRSCVYPDSSFYDSQYHLTYEGGIRHTAKIARLLAARKATS